MEYTYQGEGLINQANEGSNPPPAEILSRDLHCVKAAGESPANFNIP